MKRRTLLIILIVLVSGAAASSFPQDDGQDEGNEITADEHECPLEMTEDEEQDEDDSMENCDMSQPENCDMSGMTMEECSSMMDDPDHMADHCEDMDSMMEGHMGMTMQF